MTKIPYKKTGLSALTLLLVVMAALFINGGAEEAYGAGPAPEKIFVDGTEYVLNSGSVLPEGLHWDSASEILTMRNFKGKSFMVAGSDTHLNLHVEGINELKLTEAPPEVNTIPFRIVDGVITGSGLLSIESTAVVKAMECRNVIEGGNVSIRIDLKNDDAVMGDVLSGIHIRRGGLTVRDNASLWVKTDSVNKFCGINAYGALTVDTEGTVRVDALRTADAGSAPNEAKGIILRGPDGKLNVLKGDVTIHSKSPDTAGLTRPVTGAVAGSPGMVELSPSVEIVLGIHVNTEYGIDPYTAENLWIAPKTYPVTLKYLDDSTPDKIIEVTRGDILPANAETNPERAGFAFGGWFTESSFTPATLWNPSAPVLRRMVLHAKWNPAQASPGSGPGPVWSGGLSGGSSGRVSGQPRSEPLSRSGKRMLAVLKIGAKSYEVEENGEKAEKTADVAPLIHQGRTMLPARMIAELLGVQVDYDHAVRTARFTFTQKTVDKNTENIIELTLGRNVMRINGKEQPLTADMLNVDGRLLLPMTDIQKALRELGLQTEVKWDNRTKTVTLERKEPADREK